MPIRYPRALLRKRFPEDFDTVSRVGSRQLFVERAHQHHPPEPLDGAGRLPHRVQPIQHGRAVGTRRISSGARDREHRFRNRALVRKRQRVEEKKRRRHMQRRRQQATPELSNAVPRHRRNTAGRKNEFFRSHQGGDKNRPDSCSTRALRAGNCPLHCRRAACTTWRVRRGADASRAAERGSLLQPARWRRTGPPGRRRLPGRFARASPFHQLAFPTASPAVTRY